MQLFIHHSQFVTLIHDSFLEEAGIVRFIL